MGVGWHGGHDSTCLYWRRGDFANCTQQKITGFTFDGGYAEYMLAPVVGYRVAAISRGKESEALARKLGEDYFCAAELLEFGSGVSGGAID